MADRAVVAVEELGSKPLVVVLRTVDELVSEPLGVVMGIVEEWRAFGVGLGSGGLGGKGGGRIG